MKHRVTSNEFRSGHLRPLVLALAFTALLASAVSVRAATLSGTVTNGTTGKPAAGDDVVLLTLAQGMQESGRTKTDAQGRFSFNFDAGGPHLVRVNHQGVNYFPAGGPVFPGVASTSITVYDSAGKLAGVSENVRVMRLQAGQNSLQVVELISIKNTSQPPRSLMSDRPYEFYIPANATIDEGIAQAPNGMPINSAPVPDDAAKGRYYFVFPLRPGETRFQVAYHLPYSGEATISPKVLGRLEHFAVMMPKSMEFGAHKQGVYSPMPDQAGQSTLEVATQVMPGNDLAFRVSGTGMLQDEQGGGQTQGGQTQGGGGQQEAGMSPGAAGRPGGGLGTPEGTPDPLHKYRWAILGVCLALLAAGGGWVATRNQPSAPQSSSPLPPPRLAPAAPVIRAVAPEPAPPAPRPGLLLEALKEELFQLEVERQQGHISGEEYEKAKAALDQTLQRALARSQKAVTGA